MNLNLIEHNSTKQYKLVMKSNTINILFLIFLVFAITACQTAFAQPNNSIINDVALPAPNVAALGKYSEIPVSYYTGVPSTSIPIYTVQEGPLSLPISLDYHSNGIKVAETASWVGLGWNLSAGGMISRTVLSHPDEVGATGYWTNGKNLNMSPAELTDIAFPDSANQVNKNDWDTEPDIFHFSVPGYSGKFYFDKDNNCQFVPKQDMKLTRSGLFNGFTLTVPDGTKYYFGTADGSTITKETTLGSFGSDYPIAWPLVRVETYDGKFAINLIYYDQNYRYAGPASCSYTRLECLNADGSIGGYVEEECSTDLEINGVQAHRTNVWGKRLTRISTSTATVDFNAIYTRLDLELNNLANNTDSTKFAKRLDNITVTSGSHCSRFEFSYDYFQDFSSSSVSNLPESRRLKLLSLKERSCDNSITDIPFYTFTYEGTNNTGTINGVSVTRQFLPWRLSKAIDHWGYYNGADNNNYSINKANAPLTQVLGWDNAVTSYGNANRETSETPMLKGVLKEVAYPTGGKTSFAYQANDYAAQTSVKTPLSPTPLRLANFEPTIPPTYCTTITKTLNYTFTATPPPSMMFEMYLETRCQGLGANIKIEATNSNSTVSYGLFEFNVLPTVTYTLPLKELTSVFSLPLNQAVKFTLTVTNGVGRFEVFDISTAYEAQPKKVGGLRVAEIRTHDGVSNSNDIVRTYTYNDIAVPTRSSGVLFEVPKYGITGFTTNYFQVLRYITISSTAIVPLEGFDGLTVAYKAVKESLNGNGHKTHEFTIEAHTPIIEQGHPFVPPPFYNLDGKFSRTVSYNQSGAEVQRLVEAPTGSSSTYTYSPGLMYKTYVFRNLCPGNIFTPPLASAPVIVANDYQNRTSSYKIQQRDVTLDGVFTSTVFSYDPLGKHQNPVQSQFYNSDGKKITTKYSYPTTLAFQCLRDILVNDFNIIAVPTSTKNYVDDFLVSGDSTRWSNWSGGLPNAACSITNIPYPWELRRYEMTYDASGDAVVGSTPWVKKGEYNQRSTSNGLPLKVTQTGWAPEAYTWDTGGRLLTKTYNSDDLTAYKKFTTSFAYHSGTRLVSRITNVDGQYTDYSYDKLMRLSTISAKGGNVATTYTYQYKNPSNPRSYVKTRTTFTATAGNSLSEKTTWQYLDGLGRPVQTVDQKHSPGQKDAISTVTYDNQGRQDTAYVLYENTDSPGNTGAFRAAIPSSTKFTLT